MTKNAKIFIWQPRWNMISPVAFAAALTVLLGPCPRGPHPGDGAGKADGIARVTVQRHSISKQKYDFQISSISAILSLPSLVLHVECHVISFFSRVSEYVVCSIFSFLLLATERRYASAVYAVIVCPSVRPSVTSRHCNKTAKCRITQTTPYVSPGNLDF